MRIVLTGFNPFGGLEVNPSAVVVERLAAAPPPGVELAAAVLPTEYAAADARLAALLAAAPPAALLALGVARGSAEVRLERFALNLDDSEPDNAGDAPRGRVIAPEGPAAYRSTLPLEALHAALAAEGFPVALSNHAGTYLCNHVFYRARHELARQGSAAPCGLIHLPESAAGEAPPGMLSLEGAVRVVGRCLEVLAESLAAGPQSL